jgi:hypothetical protein
MDKLFGTPETSRCASGTLTPPQEALDRILRHAEAML